MTASERKGPSGRKIKSEKDKNVRRDYKARIVSSIRTALTYMKNLKVYPDVHRRLKTEAAHRGVTIYDLTAAAVTVGLDRPKELEKELTRLTGQRTSQHEPKAKG